MNKYKNPSSFLNVFNLRQIEYYLFINDSSIEFIQVNGNKTIVTLEKSENRSFSIDMIPHFFKILNEKKLLFGQPIRIILNLSSNYTYIKVLQESKLPEIQNSIKLLTSKEYDAKFSIFKSGKIKLFAYQAVKKIMIDTILKCLQELNIKTLQISTLQISLLSQTNFKSESNSIHSYTLFDKIYHLLKIQNDILFVNDSQAHINSIKESIFSSIEFNEYSIADSALIFSIFSKNNIKNLTYFVDDSERAKYFHTAYNSLKLLTRIALMVFLLLLISTVVSSVLSSHSDVISEYQKKYSEKQVIQNQIDSLQTIISKARQNEPKSIQAASILSMFCQKSFNNLYLTKISINNKLQDSIIVETKGYAKNEDLIFRYKNECSQYLIPFELSLNVIKPEIVNNRGLVDTNIVFMFSTAISK